ncbi:heparan-alpha-glucosaminide N-acetyltransferase [Pararhodobacter sp.]|uniref:heparan-alpha-glucosaminide N-acetyltransferase n=1 Tax=Pararhodobacter sp. TaxID=2127056 RepID=UPI002AFF0BEA|nr:heparan-alpha-glucosaminide N-acetyltransferase [Pararhodobacter sp.]
MQSPVMRQSERLPSIDIARGVALIGMVVFHFTLDLEIFGWVAPGNILRPGWMGFARLVAGSFVFLAGVSMILAHGAGIRWRSFRRGTALVAVAALAVSVATYLAMPEMWIFFGILHIIAVSRVLGLAFLRVPAWALVVLGAGVWALPYLISFDLFNPRTLAWIGFASAAPLSMDLEPIFPWFGPFLLGMAAARLWAAKLSGLTLRPGALGRGLAWAGRHSLWIYLIHQPVLIAGLWLVTPLLRG